MLHTMYITKMFIVHLHSCMFPATSRSEELRKLTEKVCAADLQVANCGGAARVPWCIISILGTSGHQQPGAGQLAILYHPHCVYQILCQHEN